jgi:hypothetical protein
MAGNRAPVVMFDDPFHRVITHLSATLPMCPNPSTFRFSSALPARIGRCVEAIDQAQAQRFELKYLVSESTARALRQFVRCYLVPDEFAAHSADFAYAVHTLYLDSPELALYAATNGGDRNRFKLRIRFYNDNPDSPVFFEVKRRQNECIAKLRAKVRREAVQPLLRGAWPQLAHLAKPDAKHFFALQEFCRLMRVLDATPRSHVAYQREAWMSPRDNSLRMTFDRQVQCEQQFAATLHASVGDAGAVEPFETQVIFELKFTNRMPDWCREMIRVFGLVRGGAAKYAEGVALMGEHRVSNRGLGVRTSTAPTATPQRRPELMPGAIVHGNTANAF